MSEARPQLTSERERLTADTEGRSGEERVERESLSDQRPALSPGVLVVKVGVPSPSGLSLDQEFKEEPQEQSIIKPEEHEQFVSVPESSAIRVKEEDFLQFQQRQTKHRKETQTGNVQQTGRATLHRNNEGPARPFSSLAPPKTTGGYSQHQIRGPSTAAAHRPSTPPFDYKKPFICSICKKTFSKKAQLEVHTRTHTGEKPFSCYFCQKLFAKKSNLDLHVRLHTGEKPYSCQYCEKTFAQISNLKVHLRTHTGEKPYRCSECEKTFAQKNTLTAHMKTHVTDRMHDCSICARSFVHKTNLDVHMRIHTGEKPYSCDYCEKTFTQNSNLKAHLRVHTGEKPYSCSMCEKTFAQKGTLDGHVKLHLTKGNPQSLV